MTTQKTSTSFRIGVSISMVIMMLGLAIFLNVFTTYAISNQMKILSDLDMPMGQEVSHLYAIQQIQDHSFEDVLIYKKLDSNINFELSKNQFQSQNIEFDSQVKKIKDLASTFPNEGLSEDITRELNTVISNLNEIETIHSQNTQKANQIFELLNSEQMNSIDSLQSELETSQKQASLKTILLNDQLQKITDSLESSVTESKQKSLALQTVIMGSAGIISLALGYFLNLINKDLIKEVIRKTKSLQKANKKLEKMNILKDDFINIASHELKSPLHPIYGFVELAQNGDIGKDEALAGISKQAHQLEEVANRILDISRIDNGILQLSYEKFNLSDLLTEIASSYRLNLNEKMSFELNTEKGIEVEADRVRIGQVLRNLLNNSLKFTKYGKIIIAIQHNLQKNIVEVSIKDSGTGIHPDILPNLFNKFVTRGPKTESWNGNGLGLYLCKGIINAHGGHILAYNNNNSGATIKFSIPIMRHINAKELHQKILN
ncbi:MAG: HAMP domain-containing histidine kinase [Thaumarchaeota archaeon]|nr:HAMP domain-containing histidine kinase [Nitrososphaerota archaeon]